MLAKKQPLSRFSFMTSHGIRKTRKSVNHESWKVGNLESWKVETWSFSRCPFLMAPRVSKRKAVVADDDADTDHHTEPQDRRVCIYMQAATKDKMTTWLGKRFEFPYGSLGKTMFLDLQRRMHAEASVFGSSDVQKIRFKVRNMESEK